MCRQFGVPHEVRVVSAHRTPTGDGRVRPHGAAARPARDRGRRGRRGAPARHAGGAHAPPGHRRPRRHHGLQRPRRTALDRPDARRRPRWRRWPSAGRATPACWPCRFSPATTQTSSRRSWLQASRAADAQAADARLPGYPQLALTPYPDSFPASPTRPILDSVSLPVSHLSRPNIDRHIRRHRWIHQRSPVVEVDPHRTSPPARVGRAGAGRRTFVVSGNSWLTSR